MKYIEAEKLKRFVESIGLTPQKSADYNDGRDDVKMIVLDFIDSLQQEQPVVDFEKAYKSYMKSRKDDLSGNAVTVNMKEMAHHFWNKGFNARKEETI